MPELDWTPPNCVEQIGTAIRRMEIKGKITKSHVLKFGIVRDVYCVNLENRNDPSLPWLA